MTKVDIISGFLGAGKTTLIKKLLKEALEGQKIVLIENEFGEIGIDGGFLKDAGVNITEMNSGCICCSLVGDFGTALKEVLVKFRPDRIIIEPSGVGKLSDVEKAVEDIAQSEDIQVNSLTTVVDAKKCRMYMKNFGEFYNNQVQNARTIVLSRSQDLSQEKLEACVAQLRAHNTQAAVITTPWEQLSGDKILEAMEQSDCLEKELLAQAQEAHHHDHECECGHHHDDHHHDHECECGHHHDDHHHDHECECGHHHGDHDHNDGHDHDHQCGHHHGDHNHDHQCGHHHGDHDHDHQCCHGNHDHHHDHHADEVFTSWGKETPRVYTKAEIEAILKALSETEDYGIVLRAKGMVQGENQTWIYFDMVPGEYELREGKPEYTGRLCVIGSELKSEDLEKLFKLV